MMQKILSHKCSKLRSVHYISFQDMIVVCDNRMNGDSLMHVWTDLMGM